MSPTSPLLLHNPSKKQKKPHEDLRQLYYQNVEVTQVSNYSDIQMWCTLLASHSCLELKDFVLA